MSQDPIAFLGGPVYLIISYVLAAFAAFAVVSMRRSQYRILGGASWFTLLVLGPLPVLAVMPLTNIVGFTTTLVWAPAAITVTLMTGWVHVMIPKIAGDFQASTFGGSLFLGAMMSLGNIGALILFHGFRPA